MHGRPEWRDSDDTADYPAVSPRCCRSPAPHQPPVRVRLPRRQLLPRRQERARAPGDEGPGPAPPFVHVYFQASSRPVPRCGLRSSWHATWCTAGSTPRARLGIDPHAGFAAAAGHLGPWTENSAITFGKHGAPFYIAGPWERTTSPSSHRFSRPVSRPSDARASIITCRRIGVAGFHCNRFADPFTELSARP